jgi:hypothetical protein
VHSVPWDTRVTTTKGPGAGTKDEASPPPSYAPQTTSFEGVLYAFEVQGASRSIGGATPVVMPRLDEDFIGLVLQEADVANFYAAYAEFEAETDA